MSPLRTCGFQTFWRDYGSCRYEMSLLVEILMHNKPAALRESKTKVATLVRSSVGLANSIYRAVKLNVAASSRPHRTAG